MFEGLRFTLCRLAEQRNQPNREIWVLMFMRREFGIYGYLAPKLFTNLSQDGGSGIFTRFNLSPRKLPLATHGLGGRSLRDEYLLIPFDNRADDVDHVAIIRKQLQGIAASYPSGPIRGIRLPKTSVSWDSGSPTL